MFPTQVTVVRPHKGGSGSLSRYEVRASAADVEQETRPIKRCGTGQRQRSSYSQWIRDVKESILKILRTCEATSPELKGRGAN